MITKPQSIFFTLCAALAAGFAPASLHGAVSYLDLNGSTPGFGDLNGTTNQTGTIVWSSDATGASVPAAFIAANQMAFGYPGTPGISNNNLTIGNVLPFAGLSLNVPCTVTLTGTGNSALGFDQTWTAHEQQRLRALRDSFD